jgi:hypothetical protein
MVSHVSILQAMSIFYSHYGCHEDALVMRKSDSEVYFVRRNINIWDMTAILVPYKMVLPNTFEKLDELNDNNTQGCICVQFDTFKQHWLVLDEGKGQD